MDVKTHVAFGEDAYQKRAMPLVPVEALIPYIYVLPNNSFIDFIRERGGERERESVSVNEGERAYESDGKGEGEKKDRGRERERETKSVHCLFTPTFPRPSFLAPFYFLH